MNRLLAVLAAVFALVVAITSASAAPFTTSVDLSLPDGTPIPCTSATPYPTVDFGGVYDAVLFNGWGHSEGGHNPTIRHRYDYKKPADSTAPPGGGYDIVYSNMPVGSKVLKPQSQRLSPGSDYHEIRWGRVGGTTHVCRFYARNVAISAPKVTLPRPVNLDTPLSGLRIEIDEYGTHRPIPCGTEDDPASRVRLHIFARAEQEGYHDIHFHESTGPNASPGGEQWWETTAVRVYVPGGNVWTEITDLVTWQVHRWAEFHVAVGFPGDAGHMETFCGFNLSQR